MKVRTVGVKGPYTVSGNSVGKQVGTVLKIMVLVHSHGVDCDIFVFCIFFFSLPHTTQPTPPNKIVMQWHTQENKENTAQSTLP